MFKASVTELFQSKNVIMFSTAICFMAGILAFFNSCIIPVSFVITVILGAFLVNKLIPYKYVLLWIFVFYIGFFNAYFRVHSEDGVVKYAPSDVVLTGRIVSIPTGNVENKVKFFVDVSKVGEDDVLGKTLVQVQNESGDFSKLKIGNTYNIRGNLRTPFKAGNPSQFDYGKYLRNFNAYSVMYADYDDCSGLDGKLPFKWKFVQELNNVRSRIVNTHAKYLKSPNSEILGGIVFGDDAVAPPDYIKDTFKNSGLLHILAASGMNVAFIYGFWYFILRRLRFPYKFTVISGMFIVILYTLMTGLGASVIRAALMLLFVLAGKLIDRDAHSVSLLAFVASLMLIYNPAYINDVGFQLSFIVTFGLLTTANTLVGNMKNLKIPDWLGTAILIPIVAQVWVIPIQMFYFNTISTYSVFANISIMPFLSVISFGGFVSSVLSIFAPFADIVCRVSDFILAYFLDALVHISEFFSNLSFALIETTHPSVFQIVLFYLIVLYFTWILKVGFSRTKVAVVVALISILALSAVQVRNNNFDVLAFDVGNADAFLLKTPNDRYFIIDTGKAPYNSGTSQAKVIILKYLKDHGIKDIDGLIITHFDNDHSGGVVDLVGNLRIKKVYVNTLESKTYTAEKVFEALKKKNIKPILVENGKSIYAENNLVVKVFQAKQSLDNESSIITYVKYGKFDGLFMGDAGISAYNDIKKDLGLSNIELLKVGHHGGQNSVSKEMVEELNPELSLISTGHNRFGHPNKVTLDVLRETDIYRTDRNNAILISVEENGQYSASVFDRSYKKFLLSKVYNSR